ncbi:hypothetical protein [Streptomyces sp. NPDC005805]|uniref:hypothetical protein n=1 Tax=Streptomyces sp. NPDC005805 TaxID=3157068 RepID=UPI0033FC62FD
MDHHLDRAERFVVTGPPGTGKSMVVANAVAAAMAAGQKIVVLSGMGGVGKSTAAFWWAALQAASATRARIRRQLEAERQRATAPSTTTAALLASAEKDTGIPGISAPHAPGHPQAEVGSALVEATVRIEQLRLLDAVLAALITLLREQLDLALGNAPGDFAVTPPPHATSPCGVIGLAAPRVPRAPGRTRATRNPSHPGALTAA